MITPEMIANYGLAGLVIYFCFVRLEKKLDRIADVLEKGVKTA